MKPLLFSQLIEGFCKLCALDEPERVVAGGPIEVNDVIFSLTCNEEADLKRLFIHCDFGTVPRGREAGIYQSLLETNMGLYTGSGPTFAISPQTRRVVLVDHRQLEQLTPASLRDLVFGMQQQAMGWRRNYFAGQVNGAGQAPAATGEPMFKSSTANRLRALNGATLKR